jgi:hypothetical protein
VLLPVGLLHAVQAMFALYALLGFASYFLYRRLPVPVVPRRAAAAPLGPSRGIVLALAALFGLDAFGGGFIVQSLLALWLFERFGLSLAAAGSFFFWSGLLAAASYLVATRIAARIGLVNTMVWTHVPSNLLLILAPFASSLPLALGRGERHRGAAQPRRRREPGRRRLAPRPLQLRLATGRRRRGQAGLRSAAADDVPASSPS